MKIAGLNYTRTEGPCHINSITIIDGAFGLGKRKAMVRWNHTEPRPRVRVWLSLNYGSNHDATVEDNFCLIEQTL